VAKERRGARAGGRGNARKSIAEVTAAMPIAAKGTTGKKNRTKRSVAAGTTAETATTGTKTGKGVPAASDQRSRSVQSVQNVQSALQRHRDPCRRNIRQRSTSRGRQNQAGRGRPRSRGEIAKGQSRGSRLSLNLDTRAEAQSRAQDRQELLAQVVWRPPLPPQSRRRPRRWLWLGLQ
jgi:hypothetical protein